MPASNTEDEAEVEEDLLLSEEDQEFLEKRGIDSLAERLKIQLIAKNGRIQYLKDVVKQLEADLFRALHSKPVQNLDKLILLDKDRSRVRIKQLQDEVTALSATARKYKNDFEREIAQAHGHEQKIEHLLEELDKERDRVQKMSVLLAACRRRESEHGALEVEVQNLRAEKRRRDLENKLTSSILKVSRLKREEHMRFFRQGVEGINQLREAFPYGKHTPREPPRKGATPRTARSRRRGSPGSTAIDDLKGTGDSKHLIPRQLQKREGNNRLPRYPVGLLSKDNPAAPVKQPAVITPRPDTESAAVKKLLPKQSTTRTEQVVATKALPRPLKTQQQVTPAVAGEPSRTPKNVTEHVGGTGSIPSNMNYRITITEREPGYEDEEEEQQQPPWVIGDSEDLALETLLLKRNVSSTRNMNYSSALPRPSTAEDTGPSPSLPLRAATATGGETEASRVKQLLLRPAEGTGTSGGGFSDDSRLPRRFGGEDRAAAGIKKLDDSMLPLPRPKGKENNDDAEMDASLPRLRTRHEASARGARPASSGTAKSEEEKDDGHESQYVKQLERDLAQKSEMIRDLHLRLQMKELQLNSLASSSSGHSSPTQRAPSSASCESEEVEELRKDVDSKSRTIKQLQEQLEESDQEIVMLQRQVEGANKWPFWGGSCNA